MSEPRGKLRRLLDRASERIGRSSQVFLIGLFVACGIEVAVDWNATLYEINVQRATLKQKGENYADLLRKAAESPLLAYDWDELERLSAGVFDDPEVVYVRYSDVLGNTLYDRLRGAYGTAFAKRQHEAFRAHYRRVMARDAGGLITDPLRLKEHMQSSRHRDFIQAFTDSESALIARLTSTSQATVEPPPRVLYQDRLADEKGRLDRGLSYAVGAVTAEGGEAYGVVLVAFSNDRLNHAIAGKLWKGLAITVFFVGLILVQNLSSRRAKLRLLDLEAALSSARTAIRAALPETPALAWGQLGVAFAQADRVGGTVYDVRLGDDGALELLLAVPEGTGVDAAFAAVVLGDLHGRLPAEARRNPERLAEALLAAYDAAPLARDVELLALRVAPDGQVSGVVAGLLPPSFIGDDGARPLPLGEPLPLAARRLAKPLRPFAASLDGGVLFVFDDGMPVGAARNVDPAEVLARAVHALGTRDPQRVAEEAVADAVRRYHKKHSDDLFCMVLRKV